MAKKTTWTQHDYNAHLKKSLALLREKGRQRGGQGPAYYGIFWIFVELLGHQNESKMTPSSTLIIPENDACKVMNIKTKSLPLIMGDFRECLGIIWRIFPKHSVNILEIDMPKALNYITIRSKKMTELELDIERDRKVVKKMFKTQEKEPEKEPEIEGDSANRYFTLLTKTQGFKGWDKLKMTREQFWKDIGGEWALCKFEAQYLKCIERGEELFKSLLTK